MTFKVKDVLALRSELSGRCSSMSAGEKRAFLAALIAADDAAAPLSVTRIKAAFARVFWVKSGLHLDLKEGRHQLHAAALVFAELGRANRLLGFLGRDTDLFLGTLFSSYSAYPEALAAFAAAIHGELNKERRALGCLNIARVHMNMGNFYQSLAAAEACDLAQLPDEVMRSYFLLLKARLLLMLGYQELAAASLSALPSEVPDQVRLEAQYLRIHSATTPATLLTAKTDYAAISAWLEVQGDDTGAQFYRLEWLVLAPLVDRESITNKRTFLDLTRYLARQTRQEAYYTLAAATLKVVQNATFDDADYADLRQAQAALLNNADHLLYQQHRLQTAHFLLARRQYALAAALLVELEQNLHKQESDLPKQLALRLTSARNSWREHLASLRTQVPDAVWEKVSGIGAFLAD